jgi:hypothetical protein
MRVASLLPLSRPSLTRARGPRAPALPSLSRARPAPLCLAQQRQVGPLAPVRSLPTADMLAPRVIPFLPLFSPVAAAWWSTGDHDLRNLIRLDQHGLLHPTNSLHPSTTKLELRRPLTNDGGRPQSTVNRENAPPAM